MSDERGPPSVEDSWPLDARAILHVDMDAFFAAVELLRHPELHGQPVVVGGAGARGVVAAASYEARAYGIRSAMSSVEARRRCQHAVFLPGDHAHYAAVSQRLMGIFTSITPLVEPLSLDEAFLDVTGVRRLYGGPLEIAHLIRAQVAETESLVCSVGVAATKFLAKLASDSAKPTPALSGPTPGPGVTVVWPGAELAFLHPLPVQRLWGVGPATRARLERIGVATVGDLARLPVEAVVAAVGEASGRHLHALSRAIDDRLVVPDRVPKSVGHEETFAVDHRDRVVIERELLRMADAVASRLRHAGVVGRTITVKVRFPDFQTITRSATLDSATAQSADVAREAKRLLAGIDTEPGVRLLGVSVSNLGEETARQLSFDDASGSRQGVDDAVDEIRGRFGDDAIGPASLLGSEGLRPKRRGDQHWGPDA